MNVSAQHLSKIVQEEYEIQRKKIIECIEETWVINGMEGYPKRDLVLVGHACWMSIMYTRGECTTTQGDG